ncbi:hypothetical protein DENSPDRAFT_535821 [Dentipellis sp. KUC8613]|nr:hypothetical protein DENSPDRAFT_535821 [Dentipellis sp. KUC8613]
MVVPKTETSDAAKALLSSPVPKVEASSPNLNIAHRDNRNVRPLDGDHDENCRGPSSDPSPIRWVYERRSGLVAHPLKECDSCQAFVHHRLLAQFSGDQTYATALDEQSAHNSTEANELREKLTLFEQQDKQFRANATLFEQQNKELLNENADLRRRLGEAQDRNVSLDNLLRETRARADECLRQSHRPARYSTRAGVAPPRTRTSVVRPTRAPRTYPRTRAQSPTLRTPTPDLLRSRGRNLDESTTVYSSRSWERRYSRSRSRSFTRPLSRNSSRSPSQNRPRTRSRSLSPRSRSRSLSPRSRRRSLTPRSRTPSPRRSSFGRN